MNRRSFVTRASALLAGIAAACSGGAIRLAEAIEKKEYGYVLGPECTICQSDVTLVNGMRFRMCPICKGIGNTLFEGQRITTAMGYEIRALRKEGAIHVLHPSAAERWWRGSDFSGVSDIKIAPDALRMPVMMPSADVVFRSRKRYARYGLE